MRDYFRLAEHRTDVRTEVIAGVTTFLTAAYIIFVNPAILSEAGMDRAALVTVTCVVSALASILMGVWANAPFMMAPGMGLNAFFTYGLCLGMGVDWQTALGVVFVSGVLFLILTVVGIREKVVDAIPLNLRLSTGVGIGLFITFIGLQKLGLVVRNDVVLVGLGKLSPTVLLGLAGFLLIAWMETRRIKGSILIGILGVTAAGIVLGRSAPPEAIFGMPAPMTPVALQLDLAGVFTASLLGPVFAFMFVDLFDSLGTMMAVSYEAGRVDKDGRIRGIGTMLSADAVATVFGALLGTSTTTTYIESASGVAEGGRTGLTAIVTGLCFLLAMVLAPLVGAVPDYATAPALMMVGVFMMRMMHRLDFRHFDEAVPAFLTILLMPLTYSISNGLIFGFLSYAVLKLLMGKRKDLNGVMLAIAGLCLANLLLAQGG